MLARIVPWGHLHQRGDWTGYRTRRGSGHLLFQERFPVHLGAGPGARHTRFQVRDMLAREKLHKRVSGDT